LESEHLVHRLRSLVEDLFGKELRSDSSLVGGFEYDPVSLTSVWIYGFLEGVLTSRRLETCCRYDLRYEFLMVSCRPDHTTLSRFRKSLGENLDEMMVRLCLAAEELGILKRRTMAVDGTKIAALKSQWSRRRKEADGLEDLEAEASTMVSHGQYLVGYNVQAAADSDSGLLVGYVVSEKGEDSDQLEAVCQAVKLQSGGLGERVVCDRGYDSPQNAQALEAEKVEAFIPSRQRGKRPVFSANEKGEMVCLAGHLATKNEWTNKKTGLVYDHYRVSRCTHCPLKGECPGKGDRQRALKVARIDPEDLKHQANARCRTEDGRKLMKQRGRTIERPFGIIKERFKLRRFHLRGKKGARIEFGLAVLTFNLQILLSFLI